MSAEGVVCQSVDGFLWWQRNQQWEWGGIRPWDCVVRVIQVLSHLKPAQGFWPLKYCKQHFESLYFSVCVLICLRLMPNGLILIYPLSSHKTQLILHCYISYINQFDLLLCSILSHSRAKASGKHKALCCDRTMSCNWGIVHQLAEQKSVLSMCLQSTVPCVLFFKCGDWRR